MPLEGIRVADFSALIPGPFATAILSDLGADVIKVEPPGGDSGRSLLPAVFHATNRNKGKRAMIASKAHDLRNGSMVHQPIGSNSRSPR